MRFRTLICLAIGLWTGLLYAQIRDPSQYGRAYLAEGDHAAAIESYQEASRVNPFDPVALNNLGVARAASGDYQSALDLFSRAAKLAPSRQDIVDNHRQLASWMSNQLRGPAGAYKAIGIQPSTAESVDQNSSFMTLSEPPPLWGSERQINPKMHGFSLRISEREGGMSRPLKKKSKQKRAPLTCSPKAFR